MKSIWTLVLLVTLASAGPEGPGRIRYRDGAIEPALAEAKASGRIVLIVVAWDG